MPSAGEGRAESNSATLRDVLVSPARAEPNNLPVGGVAWPAGAPSWVHQRRYGAVVEPPSFEPDHPTATIDRASYAGYGTAHFGHFVSEHASRVPDAQRFEPRGRFILVARPKQYGGSVPQFAYEVLEWLGVSPERVHVVAEETTLVHELVVWPAQEQPGTTPSERYLDVLDDNTARKKLAPIRSEVVYVSRSGMRHRASGEAYLDRVLAAAGVTVIHPESLSVREQLARYAGAQNLIFSEGSSMHGRQLIGRVDQRIAVLQRRKGGVFGRDFLSPRCSSLTIVDALHCSIPLSFRFDMAGPKMWEAFPLLDEDALLDALCSLGVDLRGRWRPDEFETAVAEDMSEWARWIARAYPREDPGPKIAMALEVLEESGQQRFSPAILSAFDR